MRFTIRLGQLALLLFFLGACGRQPGETVVERLIAEDPEILFSADELFETEPVLTWSFGSERDLSAWQTHGLTAARRGDEHWTLQSADGDAQLVRWLDLAANELHEIEVTLAGLVEGRATLFWAGPGEAFAENRSLTVGPPAPRPKGSFTLRFDLAAQQRWRGRIERLRLDPTDAAADTVELRSIRGLRRVVKPEELAAALGRAFKIDLSADVRSARLAVPGVAIEHRVEVGRDQRLRLSYGLDETVQQAVEFRVEALADGEDEAKVLLRQTVEPTGDDAGRWHEAALDLSAYAGRQVRLALETRTAQTLDLARGFPAWSNPEIVAPVTGQAPPNVILISIDTLRSDRLSAYGNPRQTSPNLDRWAASSAVLFQNAVVQAPWTLPSHASMFTGLEALRHDVNHYGEAPASLELLAETLRRAGYTTAAFTGGGYLRPQFGFAQGFDEFWYWPQILAERELAEGSERMLSWLQENRSRPFFLFFHTYEVHFPHRRRQPYFDRLQAGQPEDEVRGVIHLRARPKKPGDLRWQHDYFTVELPTGEEVEHLNEAEKALMLTMYDSAIAYVDEHLGILFERLEKLGLKGRTLIVLTSDHGEALGEKDRGGHNYLDDYNVMVPLVIEFPDGLGAGTRIDQQVRSIDIVPTILDVLGLEPPRPTDGVSLRPLVTGDQAAVPTEAWTYASSANSGLGLRYRNQLKYVFNNSAWSRILGHEELYDLHRDPGEQSNQAASHPSMDRLRAKARQAIEEQHEGLRLRIRNGGEGVLSGRLVHGWAQQNRVKAADPSCRCLHWQPGRGATFSLRPGQDVTLYFESIPGQRVGLRGRLEPPSGPAATFDEIFDLQQLQEVAGLRLAGDGWQRQPPSPGGVGFTIWRQDEGASLRAAGPADQELLEQLKALGYVNP